MVQLLCGTCNHPMQLPDKAIGRTARCSACGMMFVIPVQEGSEPVVAKPCSVPPKGPEMDINTPPPPKAAAPSKPSASTAAPYSLKPEPEPEPAPEPNGPADDPAFRRGVELDRHNRVMSGKDGLHGSRLRRRRNHVRNTIAVAGIFIGIAAIVVLAWVAFEIGTRSNKPTPGSQPPAATSPPKPAALAGAPRPDPPQGVRPAPGSPAPVPPFALFPAPGSRPPDPVPGTNPPPVQPVNATTAAGRREVADRLADILRFEEDQPELALARYVQIQRAHADPALYPLGFRIDEKIALMRQRVAGSGGSPVPPVRPLVLNEGHGLKIEERLKLFVPRSAEGKAVHIMGYLDNESDRFIEEARIRITVPGADGQTNTPCTGSVRFIPPRCSLIPFVVRVRNVARHEVRVPDVSACVIDQAKLGPAGFAELPILPGFRLSNDRKVVTGEVKNDRDRPVLGIRVLCELYRSDGLLLMRQETQPVGSDGPLRPGETREFTLIWAERVEAIGPEVFKIVCRAVGREGTG